MVHAGQGGSPPRLEVSLVNENGNVRLGTAGWSIPSQVSGVFADGSSALERYATRFNAAEINSSFHRSHRPSTYARWAASVPATFRFAVKLPKAITHQARLVNCEPLLDAFAAEIFGLGERRGPVLVQLPPSLAFVADIVEPFLETLTSIVGGLLACEPRHSSWFTPDVDAFLAASKIARVVADPARVEAAAQPGGWSGLLYTRLHGSPRPYWSSYSTEQLMRYAEALSSAVTPGQARWLIFDNTASGAATANALEIDAVLNRSHSLNR